MPLSMDSKVQEKETWKKRFLETMESVNEKWFALHYVATSFNSTAAFSEASFQLAAHVKQAPNNYRVGLYVKDLFKVDDFQVDRLKEAALKFIMDCQCKAWPVRPAGKKFEKQVVLDICTHVLLPLSREEVILEMQYSSMSKAEELSCSYIGMGSSTTWHGTPDVRVRGADVVIAREGAEGTTDSDESDGATTNSEAKGTFSAANLPQLITTGVVASFIEKRLHPDLQAVVPTLLMDEKKFRVCLYHCDKDVLLLSEAIDLAEDGALSRVGMAFLWLVLNHRLFLQQLPDVCTPFPANIRPRIEIEHFTALDSKTVNWASVSKTKRVLNEEFPLVSLAPARKRRKT